MAHEPDPPAAVDGRPSGVSPDELGARITELRETAGMSVEVVAARTRIRASLIRSMESGDFAPCGGAVYARGHLRSIAHVVQADDAALVAAYDRMAGKPSPAAATVVPTPPEPTSSAVPFATVAARPLPNTVQITGTAEPAGQPPREHRADDHGPGGGPALALPGSSSDLRDRRGSPMVLAAVVVVALVVVVAAIGLVRGGSGPPSSGVTAKAPSTQTAAPTLTPSSAPTSPTAPTTLAAAGVNVVVKVAGNSSWVHAVDSSGAVVFQGVVSPGTSKRFHAAQQLTFVFGYAPAVSLVVNGHDVGHPPTNGGGDVAKVVFDTASSG